MRISARRFGMTASIVPFLMLALSGTAQAQQAADASEDESEEIIVTGSSLKGVAPVGSNLTTIGRAELEEIGAQTVQQILKTVPAVVGLQSAGQGGYGSFDGAGTNAPTIHGLGASASNSTLVLLNGHRLPVSGVNHVLADPNIVAPLALERVEVLADGASSVYGSDAVAGVINFITRRNFDGLEASVQKGFGKQYGTFNAGVLGGKTWDSGSFLLSYNFSDRDNLAAADRAFAAANQTARGGRNFTPNRCSPASITLSAAQVAGTGATAGTFYTPYAATNTTAAGDCDPSKYWDLIPSETRHSLFATVEQQVSDKLKLTSDIIYSNRENIQNITRGSASGTIYGAGAVLPTGRAVNPFFQTVPVATGTTAPNQETVNFNADQLLGRGAYIRGSAETFYARVDAQYDISAAWRFNVGGLIGRDQAELETVGQLCGSCFNLALNGFTSATINGVVTNVSQALTTANAINVFGTGAATSAATLATLTDSRQLAVGDQTIRNLYTKVDGDLFELPAGAVKVAIGGEYIGYTLKQDIKRPNNLGPSSTNSASVHIDYKRNVKSAYVEMFVPLISSDQDSFIRSFDLNLSGRIDDYSDFGTTKNPKIAANLEVVEGVKFRGNWAKSFVAPALTSRGANNVGLTGESGFSGVTGAQLPGGAPTITLANFPGANLIPACATVGATTCSLGSVTGVLLTGGNGNLKPQRGKAFSFGLDLAPVQIPNLRLSVTYWSNKLRGGITAPTPALALGAADLSYLLQIFPTGATAAQVAAAGAGLPQTGTVTNPVYFIYNFQQNNVLNLNVTGLDISAGYRLDTEAGKFSLGAGLTRKLKFDQFFGATGRVFSVLGTAGFNTTFPSVKTEARFNLGYEKGGFNGALFYNYLGKYTNWSGSVATAVVRTNGVPTSGGDPVKAFATVDANLSYKFENLGFLSEASVFVDATNLFDKAPPQYNTFVTNGASAYDNINASPIGRVVSVGVRTKF